MSAYLLKLLEDKAVPQDIGTILDLVLGRSDLKDLARREVQNLLDKKVNELVAENYGRQITKAIDGVYSLGNFTLEKRHELAKNLATNAALQLVEVAELVNNYPEFARAVTEAKQNDSVAALERTRSDRKRHQDKIRQGLADVGRVLAGIIRPR